MKERILFSLWIVVGFFLGSVMFCRLLPKWILKKDIEQISEDGNPGAANVFLHCGIPMGMLCLLLDMLKSFVPVYTAERVLNEGKIAFAAVMIAPVFGHAMGVFNHFHGGKCIASSFGEVLAVLPLTRVGLWLAGLYILFAGVVRIRPNRRCSILTYTLFGLISGSVLTVQGKFSLALGFVGISAIAVLRHTRWFSTVPMSEHTDRKAEEAEVG